MEQCQKSANLDTITEAIIETATRDLSNNIESIKHTYTKNLSYDVDKGVQVQGFGRGGSENVADIVF